MSAPNSTAALILTDITRGAVYLETAFQEIQLVTSPEAMGIEGKTMRVCKNGLVEELPERESDEVIG